MNDHKRLHSAMIDNYSVFLHTVKTPNLYVPFAEENGGFLWSYVLLGVEGAEYRKIIADWEAASSSVSVIAVAKAGIGPHSKRQSIRRRALDRLSRWPEYVGSALTRFRIRSDDGAA